MFVRVNPHHHRVEEALRLKPNSWEAVGSLAQVDWERAKARMGYVLQP